MQPTCISAKGKVLLTAFALLSDEEQLDALRSANVPWDFEVRGARPSSMEEWYGGRGHDPYIPQKDYENEVKYLEEEVGDTSIVCIPRRARHPVIAATLTVVEAVWIMRELRMLTLKLMVLLYLQIRKTSRVRPMNRLTYNQKTKEPRRNTKLK
jgi:hypothetical protein